MFRRVPVDQTCCTIAISSLIQCGTLYVCCMYPRCLNQYCFNTRRFEAAGGMERGGGGGAEEEGRRGGSSTHSRRLVTIRRNVSGNGIDPGSAALQPSVLSPDQAGLQKLRTRKKEKKKKRRRRKEVTLLERKTG